MTERLPGDTVTDATNFATSYSVPANSVHKGTVYELWAAGVQSMISGDSRFSYGVKFGDTVIAGPADAFHYDPSRVLAWQVEAKIVCTEMNGSLAIFEVQGVVRLGAGQETFEVIDRIVVDTSSEASISVFQSESLSNGRTSTMRQFIVKSF